jgi:hypothetical protein
MTEDQTPAPSAAAAIASCTAGESAERARDRERSPRLHVDDARREPPAASQPPQLPPPPPQPPLEQFATIMQDFLEAQRKQTELMIQFQNSQSTNITTALTQLVQTIAHNSTTSPVQPPPTTTPEAPLPAARLPPSAETQLDHIPSDVDKILKVRTRSWRDSVMKYARAKANVQRLTDDLAVFEKDGTSYPKS